VGIKTAKEIENETAAKIKCSSRVHIVNEDGSRSGDSGWPNLLTNLSIANFLAGAMAGNYPSKCKGRSFENMVAATALLGG